LKGHFFTVSSDNRGDIAVVVVVVVVVAERSCCCTVVGGWDKVVDILVLNRIVVVGSWFDYIVVVVEGIHHPGSIVVVGVYSGGTAVQGDTEVVVVVVVVVVVLVLVVLVGRFHNGVWMISEHSVVVGTAGEVVVGIVDGIVGRVVVGDNVGDPVSHLVLLLESKDGTGVGVDWLYSDQHLDHTGDRDDKLDHYWRSFYD
jgi:hypothetical protein